MSEENPPTENKERINPYRLTLKPGEEQRRREWNLIIISDIPVAVDFMHTDLLEKVISIRGVRVPIERNREGGDVKE